ncbi:MAG: hypothetical protein IKB99_03865 [Lentisphaeria bacterium]|nr:hypothetical protein [Lentisphaeria bacterium]
MNKQLEKEIDELRKKVIEETMRSGGSTGSNMAEPLWFAPGPAVMPEDLPPEEAARIEKEIREAKEALARMAK